MRRVLPALFASALAAGLCGADDRTWENPEYATVDAAVNAARHQLATGDPQDEPALRFFLDLTLAAGDVGRGHSSEDVVRHVHDNLLVTHSAEFESNSVQRRTVDRFFDEVPGQRRVLDARLERFGYPELEGLVYLRLVDSVDAFAHLNRPSSDRMSRVGGVTYYCRYMVLPLSYVGEQSLRELRAEAARNPSIDVDDTVRRWQQRSFASLVSTFRHELVHVHTNTTLDVPAYSDRRAYPTWFHEGTATYLAADPHAGLSASYQEYQSLFFYLVQRHGVGDLQRFYRTVFGGDDVASALAEVYGVESSEQLFAASARWHRTVELGKNVLWIAALALAVGAFRGRDRPYVGALLVLVSAAIVLAVATGLAEHLYGLRGPGVVLAAKLLFVLIAAVMGAAGVRRIMGHRARRLVASGDGRAD